MNEMELTFAKIRIGELETNLAHMKSSMLVLLLDLQVFLEEDDISGALKFLKQHTGEDEE